LCQFVPKKRPHVKTNTWGFFVGSDCGVLCLRPGLNYADRAAYAYARAGFDIFRLNVRLSY